MAGREFLIKESTLSDIAETIRSNSYHNDNLKIKDFSDEIRSACSYQYSQGEQAGYWWGKDEGYSDGYSFGYSEGYDFGVSDGYESGKQDGIYIGKTSSDDRWHQQMNNLNLSFNIYTTLAPGEGFEIIEFEYVSMSETGFIYKTLEDSAGTNTGIYYHALENSVIKTNKTWYTQISTIHNLEKIGETSTHYFFRITRK